MVGHQTHPHIHKDTSENNSRVYAKISKSCIVDVKKRKSICGLLAMGTGDKVSGGKN